MCKTVKNNLFDLNPELAKEWNYEKNYPLTPQQVALNYSKKVFWVCHKNHEWEATPNARNASKTGCPYCSGKRASEENNFGVLYPHLVQDWDYEKNKDKDPYDTLPKSHQVVWWKCEKGHSYDVSVASKVRYENCPYCTGKRIGDDNNLGVLRPELLSFWDYEKNVLISPFSIAPYSNTSIYWKCDKDHSWKCSPTGFGQCPYCLNRRIDETNSLQALHPLLSKEWHSDKNKNKTPLDVVSGSSEIVWWSCSKCGHDWKASIRNRAKRETGCPECNKRIGTSFSEQSLFYYLKKVFPAVKNRYVIEINRKKVEVDIYIPELNIGIEYDGYYYHKALSKIKKDIEKNKLLKEHMQLLRIREKGLISINQYETINYTRVSNTKDTLSEAFQFIVNYLLSLSTIKEESIHQLQDIKVNIVNDSPSIYELMNLQEFDNSFGNKHPHLLPFWDNTKNKALSPFSFTENNNTKVHWKCEKGHEWKDSISNVVNRKNTCITCNSFGYQHPDLLERWDYEKNKKYNPFQMSIGSNIKVSWLCEKNHSYTRTIISEIKSKTCPYCTNRIVNKDNCVDTTYPELVKQWHPTKNDEDTPYNTHAGSGKMIWWICEKGHEWHLAVRNRVKDGRITNCPYCINQKTCEDNSLATAIESGLISSQLLQEWDTDKNKDLTPNDVVPGSSQAVWWKCEHKHSWEAPINNRVNGKGQCPTCKSFAFLYPEMLNEWNWNENKEVNPYLLQPNSKQIATWNCSNGHKWQCSISQKLKGSTCSTCKSIGFKHPHLLEEWDYEKNKDLDPYVITAGNCTVQLHWKCKHGHEWCATSYLRSRGGNLCPGCNSLGFLNPTLAKELHPIKNGELNAMTLPVSSGKKVWWKCSHNHEWEAKVSHRKNGTGCPHCPQGKVTDENRFSLHFPELSLDWNYEKNSGYLPEEFSSFSSYDAKWKCHKCQNEWKAKIADRVRGYKKCQCCK